MLLVCLLLLWAPLGGAGSPISCYNDRGEAVDWFYVYKLPKRAGRTSAGESRSDVLLERGGGGGRSQGEARGEARGEAQGEARGEATLDRSSSEGLNYLLLERGGEGWVEGKATMNDSSSAAGRTLGQLYSPGQNSEVAYILYNDQPPGDRGDSGNAGGHTKGVVLLDKAQGFWLVHSTPHFPAAPPAGRYSYPDSGLNNGQSFLCISFPIQRFQTVGEQLQINQPKVYDCDVPESLAAVAPALAALCRRKAGVAQIAPHARPVSNRSVTLTSKDGTDFISFAKGASFNNDLYHSWVAPALQSDLLVQFWIRSSGVLPSDCSRGWKVLDITVLQPGQTSKFKTSQDHSKWAVSPGPGGGAGGGGWVCVGDINRNKAEEQRGGGTVCLRDPVVWKAYRVAALECKNCGGAPTACPSS